MSKMSIKWKNFYLVKKAKLKKIYKLMVVEQHYLSSMTWKGTMKKHLWLMLFNYILLSILDEIPKHQDHKYYYLMLNWWEIIYTTGFFFCFAWYILYLLIWPWSIYFLQIEYYLKVNWPDIGAVLVIYTNLVFPDTLMELVWMCSQEAGYFFYPVSTFMSVHWHIIFELEPYWPPLYLDPSWLDSHWRADHSKWKLSNIRLKGEGGRQDYDRHLWLMRNYTRLAASKRSSSDFM